MSRQVRCKTNHSHTSFQTNDGKCECGASLQAACGFCGDFKSYGHVKSHEDQCKKREPKEEKEEEKKVRFAYWASSWALADARAKSSFSTPPRGQLFDGLPDGLSEKYGFRVHKVQDQTLRGMEWMDAYDAVFANIACDPHFKLVQVFHHWYEVEAALASPVESLHEVDVLVLGNWIHEVTKDDLTVTQRWLERLRMVEVEAGCKIFPPLDYSMTFARKELLIPILARCVRPPASPIPTVCMLPGKDRSELIASFGKEVQTLVCKRSISESKQHVLFLDRDTWIKEGKTKKKKTKHGASGTNVLWIVQPYLEEFSKSNELRLYIVDCKFLFGVASAFHNNSSEMTLYPFGPGRRDGEWSEEAVQVAEQVVQAVSKFQVDAGRFLRIDMIRSTDKKSWFINELEFFGNAFLHFEVMDDSYEFFPDFVKAIKKWIYL